MAEKFWIWLAWKLPKGLVYWCAVRVHGHATMPPWGDQVVTDLTVMVAADRWLDGAPEESHG